MKLYLLQLIVNGMVALNFCERDGRENPLLQLCGAKAATKIGNKQPDLSQFIISIFISRSSEGLAQKKKKDYFISIFFLELIFTTAYG